MEKEPTLIRDSSGQMENQSEETKSGQTEFKLYTKRWFILLIFCLTSMTNSFQVSIYRTNFVMHLAWFSLVVFAECITSYVVFYTVIILLTASLPASASFIVFH